MFFLIKINDEFNFSKIRNARKKCPVDEYVPCKQLILLNQLQQFQIFLPFLTAPRLVDPLLSNAFSLMQVCTMTINSASPQKTRIYEMGGQQTFPDCFFVAALLNLGWADGT